MQAEKLSKLIKSNTYLSASKGNEVVVLHTGKETFDSIFEAIAAARHFIHVQYYIFEEGELQDRFYKLFKTKIAEGVEVRMIYDSFGSSSFKGKMKKRFREIGVKAYPMMPLRFGSLLYTLNYRNHRKIIVIDGKVGYTGGVNVSDKYIKAISDLGIWEDLHVRLRGPVVNSLHRIFIKDYHFASKTALLLQPKYLPEAEIAGDSIAQIAASGPDSNQPAIMQQYIAMINLAEKNIFIANPYFVPGIVVLEALKIAAQSGIEVHLLVPSRGDSLLTKYSMFANFEDFLATGVNIYLRKDFSHSKVIVIDGKIASIGSGNFDYRSFEHNFEANAIIYDASISAEIKAEFEREIEESRKLSFDTFKKRPWSHKFLEGLAKFFSPLL
tara:strand:+ start:195 stop:1346 length:1152 start_codon:yes stop_codon:yes gene_type:complete